MCVKDVVTLSSNYLLSSVLLARYDHHYDVPPSKLIVTPLTSKTVLPLFSPIQQLKQITSSDARSNNYIIFMTNCPSMIQTILVP
jgi:hypothetical protein